MLIMRGKGKGDGGGGGGNDGNGDGGNGNNCCGRVAERAVVAVTPAAVAAMVTAEARGGAHT